MKNNPNDQGSGCVILLFLLLFAFALGRACTSAGFHKIEKTLDEQTATISELTLTILNLQNRIANLEKQPIPAEAQ